MCHWEWLDFQADKFDAGYELHTIKKQLKRLRAMDAVCDGDCLGCKYYENGCEGDDFTNWLLYEADDDEY